MFTSILILDGVETKKCSGQNCTMICNQIDGPVTDCVKAVTGDDPLAEAEEHCNQVRSDPKYCRSGYCFQSQKRL